MTDFSPVGGDKTGQHQAAHACDANQDGSEPTEDS
jgi:hypothetical protein